MQDFTLLSYNILSGCFDDYSQTEPISPRFELLQKAVKEVNADFVGLVDTFRWKDTFSPKELSNLFGYKHVFTTDMDCTRVDKKIGVTVLTNLDVVEFKVVRAFNRNFIETVLKDVNVYTCYFDDLSEDTRLNEATALLEQIKRPAIIHGDLNTFTRADIKKFADLQDTFADNNPELCTKLKPILVDMERGEVIELLDQQGFIDSDTNALATLPSKAFPAKVTAPFVRVDYILHTSELVASNTKVFYDGIFDQVSDHYPLFTKISVKIK